jgi:vancomycin resistance protein YoaR
MIMKLPRPRPIVTLILAVVIVLVSSGLGLTAAYAYAGDVPRGTTVLGIEIGAMSQAEATETLRAGLAAHAATLAAPVDVRIGEVEAQLDPAEVGLAVDIEATVASATDRVNPFAAIFGSREVPPVVAVDTERLYERMQEAAGDVGEAMTMPEIRFEGTEPVPTYPEPGLGLDPDASARAVTAGWPQLGTATGRWRGPTVITVPLVKIHPVTTAAEVDRLIAEFAEPAVAAPVTINVEGGGTVEASPRAIARSLQLTADPQGEIIPRVDGEALRAALRDQLADLETEPVDASVVLAGGGPSVQESSEGTAVDTEQLAEQLLAVLTDPAPRTVDATTRTVPPEFDTTEAAALGIEERVSTFTTNFEGGLETPRNHNIATVARMVDGAVVPPGETFSLNGHTGERDYAQGFQDAPVILDGRLQPAVGGGISQFTTTLFNAAYYAGLEDVEHKPHSYYYSRYPAVIEATIFYPSLDMKFRNNTEYGVLIDTAVTDNSITVSMWSTRIWDEITTEWSGRRDVTTPETRYVDPGPSCIDTQGIDGFTQDAWRVFHRDGIEVKREKFSWRYDAQPEVICDEEPADD